MGKIDYVLLPFGVYNSFQPDISIMCFMQLMIRTAEGCHLMSLYGVDIFNFEHIHHDISDKVFKNGPSKIF